MTVHPDIERLRAHREIESEPTLAECREVSLTDMSEAELAVVILHDPDLNERRAALRLYRMSVLFDAEMRMMRVLAELRK